METPYRANAAAFGDTQRGEGWRDTLLAGFNKLSNLAPSADANARPTFPGEMHAIGVCGNKPCRSNFTGPGTRIAERIRRGDPPRNPTDAVSMRHDAAYGASTNSGQIRQADKKMLKSLKKLRKNKADSILNTGPAYAGIRAKVAAEDFGLLSKNAFIDPKPPSAADKKLFEDTVESLDQQGFGRPGEKLLRQLNRAKKRGRRRRK